MPPRKSFHAPESRNQAAAKAPLTEHSSASPQTGNDSASVVLDSGLAKLQRTMGNRAVQRILPPKPIQRDTDQPTAQTDITPRFGPMGDSWNYPEAGFDGTTNFPPGVIVTAVASGGPASEKLHVDDMIFSANGQMVWGGYSLKDLIDQLKDGDSLTLSVVSNVPDIPPFIPGVIEALGGTEAPPTTGSTGGVFDSPPDHDGGEGGGLLDFWDDWTGGSEGVEVAGNQGGGSANDGGGSDGGGDGSGFFDDWVQTKREPSLIQRDMIQRDEAAFPVPAAPTARTVTIKVNREDLVPALRDWWKVLPVQGRDAKTKITKVANKMELKTPAAELGHVTRGQMIIVNQIKQNRAAMPTEPSQLAVNPYKGDKQAGYMYNGAGSSHIQPNMQGGSQRHNEVLAEINTELMGEGKFSAVNTYDDAIVTLGRGFTRSILAKVMQTFFSRAPEARDMFMDLGVTWQNNMARVVNTDTGGIEEGDNALRLIQFDKGILNLFVSMAEGTLEGHADLGQKLAQAQNDNTDAFRVPQSVVNTWTDNMAIRLVAHLIHWRSAAQWSSYTGTGGNVKEILRIVKPHIGAIDASRGGARVLTTEQRTVLFKFANGKAREALDSGTAAELPANIPPGSLANVLLIPSSGNKFWRVTH